MARPRFHKTDPQKQEAILHAAAKEFAHFGYEAASVNRILEAAGLSKGAFYYYFDDKADLAATVMLWAYRDVMRSFEVLEAPADGARFWDALADLTRRSLESLEHAPYANELLARLGQAMVKDRELAEKVLPAFGSQMRAIVGFYRRGQELGAVRADMPIEALVAVLQGIKESLIRVFLPDGQVPSRQQLEKLARLQIDLFRRAASPGEPVEAPAIPPRKEEQR